MNAYNKSTCFALVLLLSVANGAWGAELSSGNFSMGFGATLLSSAFTTTETAAFNTPDPSPGVFAFTYGFAQRPGVIYASAFSSDGPIFAGRVLANGSVGGSQVSGYSPNFQFTVGATYIDALPPGALPSSLMLRLDIDSIRIWGAAHTCCSTTNDMFWTETTIFNPGNSPSVTLTPFINSGAQVVAAGSYNQLLWNPNEFAQTGLSSSRTFVLDTALGFNEGTGFQARAIEGFEIFGSATLLFEYPVPEPSTFALLGLGACGLAIKSRRRRNAA